MTACPGFLDFQISVFHFKEKRKLLATKVNNSMMTE